MFLLFFYLCETEPINRKEEPSMQITLSSEGLWNMLQTLSPDTKRWLGEKLIEASKEEEAGERLTPYTMEEINQWLDESEADADAGRTYTTAEVKQIMEIKHPWLCE